MSAEPPTEPPDGTSYDRETTELFKPAFTMLPTDKYPWDAEPTHGLVIVGADDFAAMQFPPREYLLEPILQEKNLALVYGLRGVGKTIVGMGAALAVSTGTTFLRWQAPKARRGSTSTASSPRRPSRSGSATLQPRSARSRPPTSDF